MKKLILTTAAVFFGLATFAQNSNTSATSLSKNLRFEVRGNYSRTIKKEKLNEVDSLNDIIPYYPTNWITDYISVEILAVCNGKAMRAISANNHLTTDQKNILNRIDLNTDLSINVNYIYKDPTSNIEQTNTMKVLMTVVPGIEAEYVGGRQQMIDYLQKNTIEKFTETILKQFPEISFTINEKGEVTNTKIYLTSGDLKTDALFLEVIKNMPKWRPAQNVKGKKVKQEFNFSVGNAGC